MISGVVLADGSFLQSDTLLELVRGFILLGVGHLYFCLLLTEGISLRCSIMFSYIDEGLEAMG